MYSQRSSFIDIQSMREQKKKNKNKNEKNEKEKVINTCIQCHPLLSVYIGH